MYKKNAGANYTADNYSLPNFEKENILKDKIAETIEKHSIAVDAINKNNELRTESAQVTI